MALIIQVTVTNDESGEVEKIFVETVSNRTDSWEAARLIRSFIGRVFLSVWPCSDEW